MELFRFLTAGSVDDGKSTLIGHLLHLVNALKQDQVNQIKALSKDADHFNYAWFTDGLKSERELGITIDVSYQYFATPARRFIIADCPGHKEYTRNMFTGASTADLLVLMVNVENGITEQTRRHLKIGQLLKIPNLLICLNKMDLVDYSSTVFEQLKSDFSELINTSEANHFFIPVSATQGENIAEKSTKMEWYKGLTLLEVLNSAKKSNRLEDGACFPIQHIVNHENETYAMGNVIDGGLEVKDEMTHWPSGKITHISRLHQANLQVDKISNGSYASMQFDSSLDIKRGDILIHGNKTLEPTKTIKAKCCWMDETELDQSQTYMLKLATQEVNCHVYNISESDALNEKISLNNLFTAELRTEAEILTQAYSKSKTLGAFILINPITKQTVAAGTIL